MVLIAKDVSQVNTCSMVGLRKFLDQFFEGLVLTAKGTASKYLLYDGSKKILRPVGSGGML